MHLLCVCVRARIFFGAVRIRKMQQVSERGSENQKKLLFLFAF